LESPVPIHQRFSNYDRVPSYYTEQHAPSYYSGGNPPSFNTIDRFYINSSLEDNINLDFIFIILLFLVFMIVIFYFNKSINNFSTKPINNFPISTKPINNFPISSKNISTQEITYMKKYQEIHKGKNITYGKYYSYILFST
jgi:hypothetical protein